MWSMKGRRSQEGLTNTTMNCLLLGRILIEFRVEGKGHAANAVGTFWELKDLFLSLLLLYAVQDNQKNHFDD